MPPVTAHEYLERKVRHRRRLLGLKVQKYALVNLLPKRAITPNNNYVAYCTGVFRDAKNSSKSNLN
jgi:hypothetical protein